MCPMRLWPWSRGKATTGEPEPSSSTVNTKPNVTYVIPESESMEMEADESETYEEREGRGGHLSIRSQGSILRCRTMQDSAEQEENRLKAKESCSSRRGTSWHEQSLHKVNDRGTVAKSTGFLLRFMGDCFDRITGRKSN